MNPNCLNICFNPIHLIDKKTSGSFGELGAPSLPFLRTSGDWTATQVVHPALTLKQEEPALHPSSPQLLLTAGQQTQALPSPALSARPHRSKASTEAASVSHWPGYGVQAMWSWKESISPYSGSHLSFQTIPVFAEVLCPKCIHLLDVKQQYSL